MTKEKIVKIEEIKDVRLGNVGNHSKTAQLGIMQMICGIMGYGEYDGYKITTTEHEYFILISNMQNCCEDWGYMVSEDDFDSFIGKTLVSVELTNMALDKKVVEKLYCDDDQIQFVDFKMSNGSLLQFAVYNAHNGYYGHPIIVAKDTDILLSTTL